LLSLLLFFLLLSRALVFVFVVLIVAFHACLLLFRRALVFVLVLVALVLIVVHRSGLADGRARGRDALLGRCDGDLFFLGGFHRERFLALGTFDPLANQASIFDV
jgi:hypothetical protein